ncbi:hypothetical protein D9M68_984170 [compost metagenome]
MQRADKVRAVGARVGQGGRVVEENIQITVGNGLGQAFRGFKVQAHGTEPEGRAAASLLGNGAGQRFVVSGMAEQHLGGLDADQGGMVFEVVKEM